MASDRQQGLVTHLLEVAEFVVLAQLFEVVDSLGVVEAVVVVDFAVTCQLTELCITQTQNAALTAHSSLQLNSAAVYADVIWPIFPLCRR